MKIFAVNIGRTNIEFHNNMWTGHESIYVNGERISKKWSIFGASHYFEVEEEDGWADYVLTTGIGMMGVSTSLSRNGVSIVEGCGYGTKVNLPKPNSPSYLNELV